MLQVMKLVIELHSYLEQYSPREEATFSFEMPEGSRVRDLIERLRLPDDLTSVVTVSGNAAGQDTELTDGDRVVIIPPLAGG
jgi:molybdopterin converting factor small subunit